MEVVKAKDRIEVRQLLYILDKLVIRYLVLSLNHVQVALYSKQSRLVHNERMVVLERLPYYPKQP